VTARGISTAPVVLEWPELGVHRLLGVGTDAALREAVLAPGVARLLEAGGPELLRTARAYLDEAGSAQRTAQVLGIHRQTLYHRLERIERLSGLGLDSGRDRLQLHLALTLLPGLEP
jgi:DNA-binding PucR family transcriptional regulator